MSDSSNQQDNNAKFKTGKKYDFEPNEALLAVESKIGYETCQLFFQMDKPEWIQPAAHDPNDKANHKDNDRIVLADSGHLNESINKIDFLKKWCFSYIDDTKKFKKEYLITLSGYASIDGNPVHNKELSRRRVFAIKNWIEKYFSGGTIKWVLKEYGDKEANKNATTERQRQWDRRVDLNMDNFSYTIFIYAYKNKHYGDAPVLQWWVDFEKYIQVQQDSNDPNKISIQYEKTGFDFKKGPAALYEQSLKIINDNKSLWAGKIDKEIQELKDFFEMHKQQRLNTL